MSVGFFSLNQIDQTCRKAARGVGMFWGVADEVGKAMRWLNTFGLDSLPLFIDLLEYFRQGRYVDAVPRSLLSPWRAERGRLNPLMVGIVLSDVLEDLNTSSVETADIDYPLLAAGFLGQAAISTDQAVKLGWGAVELMMYRDELVVNGNRDDIALKTSSSLSCMGTVFPESSQSIKPVIGEVAVNMAVWQQLEVFAHHTYVEATEQSRQAGAGAGLSDND